MNVALVSLVTSWHGLSGGMEVHGTLLAEGLAALGHKVTVLASRHPSGLARETRAGVAYEYLTETTFGSQRGAWSRACYERFVALHRQRPFDVLCSQQGVVPRRLLRLCLQARLPLVAIMEGHEGLMLLSEIRQSLNHGAGYHHLPRRILAFAYHHLAWERPLLRHCASVIAVSDEIARSIRRWFGIRRARVDVVYNGVDTSRFRPSPEARASVRNAWGVAAGQTLVLFLSHVTRQKGLHVLLRALPRVLADDPGVRVAVVGDGEYLSEGRRLAATLGVEPAVSFLGGVPHERTPECLAGADVFVMPTIRQEGLPFALLEAMACARPVIASRVGGIPSVVTDGVNGLMVRAGDAGELGAALCRLLRDRSLADRLGERARQTVERGYSAGDMVRGTADVLAEAAKGRPQP